MLGESTNFQSGDQTLRSMMEEEEEEVGWICSISEHTELVQGRELNDGLK